MLRFVQGYAILTFMVLDSINIFKVILYLLLSFLIHFYTYFQHLVNGIFACKRKFSSIKSSGNSYFKHKYIFSRVLSFMCGQSLQAQLLLGGAGIKRFYGVMLASFCVICQFRWLLYILIAVSVWVYFNSPVVEYM